MKVIISTAVIGAIVVLYWVGAQRARRGLEVRFANRPNLEFEQFFKGYYSGRVEKDLLRELLDHVAQELSIPSEKLRPTDRFDSELLPAPGWDFDAANRTLLVELSRLARKKRSAFNIKDVKTLDDYLMGMASLY